MPRISQTSLRVRLRQKLKGVLVPKRWSYISCGILIFIWLLCIVGFLPWNNFGAMFSFVSLHFYISEMDFTGIQLVRRSFWTINKEVMFELLTLISGILATTVVLFFGVLWQQACILYLGCCFVIFVIVPRNGWKLSLMPFFAGILFGPLCCFFRKCWPETYGCGTLEKHVRGALCYGFAAWCIILWYSAASQVSLAVFFENRFSSSTFRRSLVYP